MYKCMSIKQQLAYALREIFGEEEADRHIYFNLTPPCENTYK